MSDDAAAGQKEDEQLDLSSFGNLTPIFSNRFYVFTGPVISKVVFGEIMRTGGDISYHTSITIPTVDLISLRDLLDRLIQKAAVEEAKDETNG